MIQADGLSLFQIVEFTVNESDTFVIDHGEGIARRRWVGQDQVRAASRNRATLDRDWRVWPPSEVSGIRGAG